MPPPEPARDCALCPRLAEFRAANRSAHPDWHNAPVPSFGGAVARLLIVGLAPGLRGANRTGRPFTGDFAGDLLYPTLIATGLATGGYGRAPDDGLVLNRCRITNAVRCVPPENKPTGAEGTACRRFLVDEIAALANLRAVIALGTVAHDSVVRALGLRKADHAFAHGAIHRPPGRPLIADCYHCSRLNTNTGRLTEAMFVQVFERVSAEIA